MPDLPGGTVTFLFTDIEGSTQLLQRLGDEAAARVFADHRRLLREAFEQGFGRELETQGDGFLVVFQDARRAVRTAVAAQRAIKQHAWPAGIEVRIRMGLHTGEPVLGAEGYVGLDVHRAARICAAGWGGQILLSHTTAGLIRDTVPPGLTLRDLGSHRLKDLQRAERIFQAVHPDLPADFPPLRSLDRLPNNLPIQLTSFIGREREMAAVARLLSTTRLLTLTGSGGAGKTRLALQVAADLADTFSDGVWLAELASLADPSLVPQALAAAVRLHEQPGRPMRATLTEYLQPRQTLLVLDNCEHLVSASAHLADALLRACPHLQILATSRQPLEVAGETVWRVPSLSSPHPDHLPPVERLTQYEAVRLFFDRAAAAYPEFRITPQNAPFVADVCFRLDGIPLAIELAAARVKVLSVEQIAQRLDDRFRLLTRGSRTALPRQQTLLAAMDWSYALLSDKERTLLRRLSVFAGWTLQAAEAVCAGEGLDGAEVFDLLSELADKSLVVVEHLDSTVRYRMLETIRQYAREKLRASGEDGAARRRHRDWYLGLAERAQPELYGPGQAAWIERLELEHDNFRAALARSQEDEEGTVAGLRLAAALWRFWWMHGDLTEGRRWLESFLQASGPARIAARAHALVGAGMLAWIQSDYDAAAASWEESLTLARELDDRRAILDATTVLGLLALTRGDYAAARALYEGALAQARALEDKRRIAMLLNNLGLVVETQGDYEAARRLHEESLAISRERGDPRDIGHSLNNLGLAAAAEGNQTTAKVFFEESLRIFKELGYKLGVAHALKNLALVAHRQGDDAQAAAMAEGGLALARELGDKECMADALTTLGRLARQQGDQERAARLWAQGLELRRNLGDRPGIAECLEGLAAVAAAQGEFVRAARLMGAADAARRAIGAPLPPADRTEHGRLVAAAQVHLGQRAFETALGEGQAMALERAVEEALAAIPPALGQDFGSPPR